MVSGRIWLKLELIEAFMHATFFCKNEEDPIKNEGARVVTHFPTVSQRRFFSDP